MLFNTTQFLLFFAVAYTVYWLLRSPGRQNVWLVATSFVFYGAWNWKFVSLLLLSIVVDYSCGRMLAATSAPRKRKAILALSIFVNLGVLAFFKYFNFFAESLIALFNTVGLEADPLTLDIILPVGISFYTFQTLGYTVDVYRHKVEPTRDPIRFAAYVSFFPQLVAGPIERASRLLPQLAATRRWRSGDLVAGIELGLLGLFKKAVVADNLAPVVDSIFGMPPESLGTGEVVVGVLAFTFQIYGDFSGYTDMARGTARALGIDLMENFRAPYFARNPSDFWKRWHVSLSSWLRDYLYIPLGGNRHGSLMTYRNLMITMLLGGLWHGAAWNFVLWGAYHGGILSAHRALFSGRRRSPPRAEPSRWQPLRHLGAALLFFPVTCYGWLLFRAQDFDQIASMSGSLATLSAFSPGSRAMLPVLLHFSWFVMLLQALRRFASPHLEGRQWVLVRSAAALYMAMHILAEGEFGGSQFIYFQF